MRVYVYACVHVCVCARDLSLPDAMHASPLSTLWALSNHVAINTVLAGLCGCSHQWHSPRDLQL